MAEWIDYADCDNPKHKDCFVSITGNTKTSKVTFKHHKRVDPKKDALPAEFINDGRD